MPKFYLILTFRKIQDILFKSVHKRIKNIVLKKNVSGSIFKIIFRNLRQNILYIRKYLTLVAKLEQHDEEIDEFLKKYLKMSKILL